MTYWIPATNFCSLFWIVPLPARLVWAGGNLAELAYEVSIVAELSDSIQQKPVLEYHGRPVEL